MMHRFMSYKTLLACLMLFMSSTGMAQMCNDRVTPTTPDSRFEVSGGEVKDLQTGLIWQRCSVGQSWDGTTCSGSATTHYRQSALALATGDWRVPNYKELSSIVETACYRPAINLTVFPNTPSATYTFSSSPPAVVRGSAWCVFFDDGSACLSGGNVANYVRLVRDGQ